MAPPWNTYRLKAKLVPVIRGTILSQYFGWQQLHTYDGVVTFQNCCCGQRCSHSLFA